MNSRSSIEWTETTWNPVTGCTQVSPGCKNCYALRFAERWRGIPGHPYEQGFDVRLWPDRLKMPLSWKKGRTIFVNSMSDLFHEQVPVEFILQVFEVMGTALQHRFQILTKRHARFQVSAPFLNWTPNIWMGVSVETNRWGERIAALRDSPAVVKFLSCEPLLGPLDINLHGIDWVIVGGESGPKARPMRVEWALDIRDQCQRAGIPFFFKQWGEYDAAGRRRGKKRAGRILDGQLWNEMPQPLGFHGQD